MLRPSRAVVLSGCSGGGKSTLLERLASRGFATVDEPGRRIVRHELDSGGQALPWLDAARFAQRCIDVARADLAGRDGSQWTFFDRGLVDADAALRHYAGASTCSIDELQSYHQQVFLTPPWPELYVGDEERQLEFAEAVDEYWRLLNAYEQLGYTVTVLPKVDIAERAFLILSALGLP
ncbi:AAA family ATPase [Gordonia araii NBRC 100433]|nr:AAA family ATPase [Gordonia araii]NNG98153.1 AAA family ATPase [Gordonia araii NBRC 100433]